MGRPKKKKVEEVQGTETTKTIVKEAKVKPVKQEEKKLKDGDSYLVLVGGEERYMTRYQIHVARQRGDIKVVLPKGSPLVVNVPQEDCVDCG